MNPVLRPYLKKRSSGIEWLGDIPSHWNVVKGKHLFRCVDERSLTGGEELLTVSSDRGVVPRASASVTMFKADSYVGHKLCWPGDLVINSLWAWGGGLGFSKYHGLVSSAYGVYRLRNSAAHDTAYFHRLLRSLPFNFELRVRSKGIWTSRLQLTNGAFLAAPILLPPYPEQTAIAGFLDHVDRRIQKYIRAKEKLIALLKEHRLAATAETMQQRNAPRLRLGVVAEPIKRPVSRVSDKSYVPIGLFNRGRGIFKKQPRRGNELGDSDFFWVREGDLVISGQFAWEGAVALAGKAEDGCVATHRYPILRGRAGVLETGYLLSFLQTDWGQLLLDHHSRGAAGRNRPLNARTLAKEKIPIPLLDHQTIIKCMLQHETGIRSQVQRWKLLFEEFRTRLIADAVTGKLDVREVAANLPKLDYLDDDGASDVLNSEGMLDLDEATART